MPEATRGGESRFAAVPRLLAAAGWADALTGLLLRYAHDLNGRAMALDAWVQIHTLGRTPPHPIDQEVDRVMELAQALSSVPHALSAGPAALMPADLLDRVGRLFRRLKRQGGDLQVELDGAPVPLLAGEHRSIAALLLLLTMLEPADGGVRAVVSVVDDGASITLTGSTAPPDGEAWDALRAVLELDQARVSMEGAAVTLAWPSLGKARAALEDQG